VVLDVQCPRAMSNDEKVTRALSVRQPWAELIARGTKPREFRSWATAYRGPLLIVASKGVDADDCREHEIDPKKCARGVAVCLVDLVCIEGERGDYEWVLQCPRRVEPVPIAGRLSLYAVPSALIRPETD
jgi:hypothetical protein